MKRGRIVLLLAVIGQRLPRHLSAGDAAAIGECSHEQRIDGGVSLEYVQNLLNAFVNKRDRANLNAHHGLRPGCGKRLAQCGHRSDKRGGACILDKLSAIHC